jgi:hypothetical protein
LKKSKLFILLFAFCFCFLPCGSNLLKAAKAPRGIWINLWNYPKDRESFFRGLQEKGINTVYLQISRSNTADVKFPEEVDSLLKEANSQNIAVIGWTYAFLKDPTEDARKFVIGARLPGISGMAVDLEENITIQNLKAFSQAARQQLGPKYPITAITYNPALRPIGSCFPWRTFAQEFEVIAPMIYWHSRELQPRKIYNEASQSLSDLKNLLVKVDGRAKIIHPIGDSHETDTKEVRAFLKACKDQKLIGSGVSLYPFHLASNQVLRELGSGQDCRLQVHWGPQKLGSQESEEL